MLVIKILIMTHVVLGLREIYCVKMCNKAEFIQLQRQTVHNTIHPAVEAGVFRKLNLPKWLPIIAFGLVKTVEMFLVSNAF